MAENVFAIRPDSHLASGHAVKGGLARPKKKALCDVKNTLLAKKSALNEPPRKLGGQPSQLETPCKPFVKENPVKETPGKVTLKQGGTFAIACDDKENFEYWDSCGASKHEDYLFETRCPSERLKTADVNYLSKGLFDLCLKKEDNVLVHPCYEPAVEEDAIPVPDIKVPTISLEPLLFAISDDE